MRLCGWDTGRNRMSIWSFRMMLVYLIGSTVCCYVLLSCAFGAVRLTVSAVGPVEDFCLQVSVPGRAHKITRAYATKYRPRIEATSSAWLLRPDKCVVSLRPELLFKPLTHQHRLVKLRNHYSIQQHTVLPVGELQGICPRSHREFHCFIAVIAAVDLVPVPVLSPFNIIPSYPAATVVTSNSLPRKDLWRK